MQLSIFGATGKTGRLVVERAVARDHTVNVLVRDRTRLVGDVSKIGIFSGGLGDAKAISAAVEGSDVVISVLGAGALTAFGAAVIPLLPPHSRLISLVGAGIQLPGDGPSTFGRSFMIGLMKVLTKDILEDASRHAHQVLGSDLDYTLVRPPRLTLEPAGGNLRHAPFLSLGPLDSISRADLANFILSCAEDGLYVRQAPMVANTR